MNMAVPVSFFHRDLALGRGLLKAAAAEATAGLTVSAVPLPELLATGACALAALASLAAIEAAKTTAAKLVPEDTEGADGAVDGTAKIFIEAKSGGRSNKVHNFIQQNVSLSIESNLLKGRV
jgi:hypothetical protein